MIQMSSLNLHGETMKLEELMDLIAIHSGNIINQSMLAESLGITRQTVSNRIKNDSEVTVSELKKVEEYFNINLFGVTSDITHVDYYSDVFASCGNGNIIFSSEKSKIPIPTSMIKGYSKNKLYSMINATGNSMSPTINNGDKLIVEHWHDGQIQDDKIYVFAYNGEFFVKRLSKNFDEIIIKSDNPEYRTRNLDINQSTDLVLIGKIVASIKQFD